MSQFFAIHPETPQPRLIRQAARIIHDGGLVVLPTDSCYAIGCHLDDKAAAERLRQIRKVDKEHNFTLVCRDLSEISTYARVDKADYRLVKSLTPGPYTFILRATHEVPRRLQHPKRKTIGIRVPDNAICQALLAELEQYDEYPAAAGGRLSDDRCGGYPRSPGAPGRSGHRRGQLWSGANHRRPAGQRPRRGHTAWPRAGGFPRGDAVTDRKSALTRADTARVGRRCCRWRIIARFAVFHPDQRSNA